MTVAWPNAGTDTAEQTRALAAEAAEVAARAAADAAETSARTAADATKQDASTAATDAELAGEATARDAAIATHAGLKRSVHGIPASVANNDALAGDGAGGFKSVTPELVLNKGQAGGYARFTDYVIAAGGTADDTAAVQAALDAVNAAGRGVVRGIPGTTYTITAPLRIGSNTTLDVTGCVVRLAAGVRVNMLQNRAVAPVTTATDVTTVAGNSVVTSPTLAAAAAVGQQLAVVAAGPPGGDQGAGLTNIWLYGTVLSVAGNNITLTGNVNGVAAHVALSGATGYLFNRDKDITIVGGTWDAGNNWDLQADRKAAGFNSHQIRLRRIDRLRVRGVTLKMTNWPNGQGLGWVFGINPADCTDFVIENCHGDRSSTVVQGDGPLYRGIVRNITGSTQDDEVAFGTVGFQGNDTEGDIIDVLVDGVDAADSWTNFKLFGGFGSNTTQRQFAGITAKHITGFTKGAPVNIIDYTGAGQTWVDCTIEDVSCLPGGVGAAIAPMVYISVGLAQTIRLKNLQWPRRADPPANGVVKLGKGPSTNARLLIDGMDIRGGAGNGIGLWTTDTDATGGAWRRLELLNVTQPDGFTCHLVQLDGTATVERVVVKGFTKYGPGWVVFNTTPGTVRKDIVISDGRIDINSASSGIYGGSSGTQALTMHWDSIFVANPAAGPSNIQHPATIIATNCEFNLAFALLWANGANALLRFVGDANIFPGATKAILVRTATPACSVDSPQGTVDPAALTPQDGDIIFNSNAAYGAGPLGVGRAIFNTAAGKWKNLYSGALS